MQSNTKLSAEQKEILKDFKRDYPEIGVVNLDNKTTMAYVARGNTVEFALSVMSGDEKKFRRKVGEYHAYNRFLNCETVKMDKLNFITMCEYVWDTNPIN